MSTGMPELGSKISLISKADIRYEGRLFTVDPQECTIALSSVRSFGTEDRETQFPVPAQNQVYDYILFRGSDIKDIRVLNNVQQQPLNDPAIMQLSVPPSLTQQPFQNHPVVGQMMPPLGQFGNAYGGMNMGGMPSGLAPGMGIPQDSRGLAGSKPSELIVPGAIESPNVLCPTVEPPHRPSDHATVLDLIGGTSRSTTPVSLSSRKSPTNDQSVQAGSSGRKDDKRIQRPNQVHNVKRTNQRVPSRERRNSKGAAIDGQDSTQNRNQNKPQTNRHYSQNQGYQNQGYQNHGYQNHGYQNQGYQNQGARSYMNHNQQEGQFRGGWVQRGPMRPRGRPRGGFKLNQSGQLNQTNKKNTLKFDSEYDFEQANTEFEELRSQLAKVKIDEVTTTNTTTTTTTTSTTTNNKPEVNGDTDKKDDSGNETGVGETEQEEDHEVFYDKAKSFFDKISCEAVERAKGKSQRTDWRAERKLNSETFGVAATRRGHFRGRGGFRGMGFRGGYRGGYRPQQRRDQPPQQVQSEHHQQQQQQQSGKAAQNPRNENSSNKLNSNEKTDAKQPMSPAVVELNAAIPLPSVAAK